MSAGLEVLELPGLTLTATSATIEGPIDRPSVLAALDALFGRQSMTKWQAGDLMLALVDDDDGDRARTFRELAGRFDQAWISSAMLVAERVAPERRRPALSWGHHELVAGLPADEQDMWLGRAHREQWDLRMLGQKIHDAKQPALPGFGGSEAPKLPWRRPTVLAELDRVLGSHGAAVVRADGTVAPFDLDVIEAMGRET